MKYKVHIEETLAKDVYVEAGTRQDAHNFVQDKIDNEGIILSADDFTGSRTIEVYTATPFEIFGKSFVKSNL